DAIPQDVALVTLNKDAMVADGELRLDDNAEDPGVDLTNPGSMIRAKLRDRGPPLMTAALHSKRPRVLTDRAAVGCDYLLSELRATRFADVRNAHTLTPIRLTDDAAIWGRNRTRPHLEGSGMLPSERRRW